MRHAPFLTAAAICTLLVACSQAEAPPDTTVPPPAAADADAATEPETPSTDAAPAVSMYDCEGTRITATFDGDAASVSVDGQVLALYSEPAASGAKYADEAGNVLWTRGPNDALLTVVGQPDRACMAVAPPH
ncbi:MliC family protein [Luteimonas sp. BDR2-5]|uniref:MliC family protein n=1 Tax=Proluteimonas luteida TaxID=2878685 RepID=UPI001E2A6F9A|nr:MliC family protein [Luteimonas sp. BDR2-5]MCD9026670.1 MliC family protein [Luteimonas sp. BDR2-5]